MPPKMMKDVEVPLTDAQRYAYDRAENDGIVHLNELGSDDHGAACVSACDAVEADLQF